MGFEPLLIAVGIGGVIFMLYAFNVMKLLKGRARLLAISAMMVVTVLLSNRLLDNRLVPSSPLDPAANPAANPSANSFWDLLPFQNQTSPDMVAKSGWQDLPLDVLGLVLAALQAQPAVPTVPTVPTVPAVPTPSLSPAPLPASPAPALIPTPAPAPPASPTFPPVGSQPIQPNPQPIQPPAQPSPQPYRPYVEPSPRPASPAAPTQPPISAWW